MIEIIRDICAGVAGVSGYKIQERNCEAVELFFVENELDMNRGKKVRQYQVTVYHDFCEADLRYKGSATVKIHPTMNPAEIRRTIAAAVFAAKHVKNQDYPLAKPGQAGAAPTTGSVSAAPATLAVPVAEAVFGAAPARAHAHAPRSGAWINSAEVFLSRIETRVVNSEGVDVSESNFRGEVELIADWGKGKEEVELYKLIRFSAFDPEQIGRAVADLLELCRAKGGARPTPAIAGATVLLSGAPVRDFLHYYYMKAAARNVYEKSSTARLGENIQGPAVRGDRVSLRLEPGLANSTASHRFDEDGTLLAPAQIFADGKLVRYWGNQQFAHYLQAEPTGIITNQVYQGGSLCGAALQSDCHLELLDFSDFQMDVLTGDFGGEIRFGWCYEGGERYPVSGGAISGNIGAVQEEMYFSKELRREDDFMGPQTVKLDKIAVTGGA